jgi:hypothetical protein
MKTRLTLWLCLAGLALACSALTFACDDDDDDGNAAPADDDDNYELPPECPAENLCQLAVDCELVETIQECLDEADALAGQCADANGYGVCICDCFLEDPNCGEYVNCGVLCADVYCY